MKKVLAKIRGNSKNKNLKGIVKFLEKENDEIIVVGKFFNLPTNTFLGFHIHEKGKCIGNKEDEFKEVGKHYNPDKKRHPNHRGDLPSIYSSDGNIEFMFETNKFSLDEIVGKSIIIHSQRDDFKSQPAGDAGNKIACGVIKEMKIVRGDRDEVRQLKNKLDSLQDTLDWATEKGYSHRLTSLLNQIDEVKKQIEDAENKSESLTEEVNDYKSLFVTTTEFTDDFIDAIEEGGYDEDVFGNAATAWDMEEFGPIILTKDNKIMYPFIYGDPDTRCSIYYSLKDILTEIDLLDEKETILANLEKHTGLSRETLLGNDETNDDYDFDDNYYYDEDDDDYYDFDDDYTDKSFKASLIEAKKFAKKHQKGLGAFVNLNAGDVEKGMNIFNKNLGDNEMSGENLGENMKINIREALNKIDMLTCETDLVNMYESVRLTLAEKKNIVNHLKEGKIKAIESLLYKKLNEDDEDFYEEDETFEATFLKRRLNIEIYSDDIIHISEGVSATGSNYFGSTNEDIVDALKSYLESNPNESFTESYKVVDKDGNKVPQGGGFTSKEEAEMFAAQYGEKDLKVVKESFKEDKKELNENISIDSLINNLENKTITLTDDYYYDDIQNVQDSDSEVAEGFRRNDLVDETGAITLPRGLKIQYSGSGNPYGAGLFFFKTLNLKDNFEFYHSNEYEMIKEFLACTDSDLSKHFDSSAIDDLNEDASIDEEDVSMKDVLTKIIKKFGNHKYKYELIAEGYERYSSGGVYTKTFFAPNDYLALFSMYLHEAPTVSNFEDYMDSEELYEYFQRYPTYEDLLDMASANWWGDGTDYIISLKNLTTDEILYEGDGGYDEDNNDYDFDDDYYDDDEDEYEEIEEPKKEKTSKWKVSLLKAVEDAMENLTSANIDGYDSLHYFVKDIFDLFDKYDTRDEFYDDYWRIDNTELRLFPEGTSIYYVRDVIMRALTALYNKLTKKGR